MMKAASYILSSYSFIFTESLDKILNVGYYSREGNPIPSFDENLLIELCSDVQQIFEKEDNILKIDGNFIIVGDIHGSLHDLLRILKYSQDNVSKFLFLGDYVDRGNFSLECITILFALKVMYPDLIYLIRGNHEFDALCKQYGFKSEIVEGNVSGSNQKQNCDDEINIQLENSSSKARLYENTSSRYKYSEKLYNACLKVFSYLPFCAIVNNRTFCVHGGLSSKLNHIDNINKFCRPIHSFEDDTLLSDILWSDPSQHSSCLFQENPRGLGNLFNAEATINFLKSNSFDRIIRAHQCVQNGSHYNFGDKCITVFSASSYDKSMNNYSAVLQLFRDSNQIHISNFPPIERLLKSDAFYYKVQPLNSIDAKIPFCFSMANPVIYSNVSHRMIPCKSLPHIISRNNESLIPKPRSSLRLPIARPRLNKTHRKSIQ